MSTVLVVAPILIANWPVIAAAVGAGVGTMGFAAVNQKPTLRQAARSTAGTREEIELEDSEILDASAGTSQEIVVQRDGVRAVFSRDARGALRVCMEGEGYSKAQLRQIGEELIGRVKQQFAYHRLVTELKERNMNVVDEQLTESGSVKIRVRNW